MNKWGYYILIIVQNRCHSENQFPSDQREFAILKKGKRNLLMSLVIKKSHLLQPSQLEGIMRKHIPLHSVWQPKL